MLLIAFIAGISGSAFWEVLADYNILDYGSVSISGANGDITYISP